jgi:hypothetical protein
LSPAVSRRLVYIISNQKEMQVLFSNFFKKFFIPIQSADFMGFLREWNFRI